MATKGKKGADPSRFEGNGVSYKAKLIGIEPVPEARGDQMCQEAITKLKNSVKISGQHKQKIFVNVTLEGLKIIDAISLANQNKKKNEAKGAKENEENEETKEKEEESVVLHTHQVHRISFISRDVADSRAFGYIYGDGDGSHKFFAIKTAAAAENLVLTLRDLFQVVYEMKKKEMEEAKEKMEKGEEGDSEENSQTSGAGSTSGNAQTPATATADSENIYSVPPNNAPVKPETRAEEVANLLDLEDQAEHILKGIEQIKNLDFDSVIDDGATTPVSPPTSPISNLASSAAKIQIDPWGTPTAVPAPASVSSSLGDLAGLQTSTFSAMPSMAGTPFPVSAFGAQPTFNPMAGGLPVTRDPFGNDPFAANAAAMRAVSTGAYVPSANPFGTTTFGGQPGMPGMMPGMMPGQAGMMPGQPGMMPGQPGMMPGQPGMMPGQPGVQVVGNPFAMAGQAAVPPQNQFKNAFATTEDPNLLTPIKKDGGSEDQSSGSNANARSKSPKADLFGDLLDIKKENTAAPSQVTMSPKELFAKQNAAEKKSMNELMAKKDKPPAAAAAVNQGSSPFGDFGPPPVNGNPSGGGSLMD